MKLIEALEEVEKKEAEGKKLLDEAQEQADEIRLDGEEQAAKIYRDTRAGLKQKVIDYRKGWEKKLEKLRSELEKKGKGEAAGLGKSAGKKRKKAADAAYALLVRGDEGTA